jgi:hypothetical protein
MQLGVIVLMMIESTRITHSSKNKQFAIRLGEAMKPSGSRQKAAITLNKMIPCPLHGLKRVQVAQESCQGADLQRVK